MLKIMRLRDPTITLETPSPHHGFHPAASQWRFSNEISCNMSLHVVVRSLSRVRLCDSKDCSMPGFPVLQHHPVCSNSCPLNRWCHSIISSSVVPFSSCLQSLPASGSFLMSQLFPSGGQNIGASASASVPPTRAVSPEQQSRRS